MYSKITFMLLTNFILFNAFANAQDPNSKDFISTNSEPNVSTVSTESPIQKQSFVNNDDPAPVKKNKGNSLLENLLGGIDLKINELLTTETTEEKSNQFKVVFSLVAKNGNGEKTSIEIFSSDVFSNPTLFNSMNKEFFITSKQIFRTLEPHLVSIEKADKLKLELSLNRIDNIDDKDAETKDVEFTKQVLQQKSFEVYFRSSI